MNKPNVVVIDFGVGNLLSVQRGLEFCGANVIITSDPDVIATAERVVLPGVGAFANAMQALHNLGLIEAIKNIHKNGTPLLGICLGMQLLLDESEEFGSTNGLSLISGRVVPLPDKTIEGEILKKPQIGWNGLLFPDHLEDWKDTILSDVSPGESVYFIHSYMALPSDNKGVISVCNFGNNLVPAVISQNNVIGCQFHPEKSGEVGLRILRNFCFD
jgi:glutamine amidotransferase